MVHISRLICTLGLNIFYMVSYWELKRAYGRNFKFVRSVILKLLFFHGTHGLITPMLCPWWFCYTVCKMSWNSAGDGCKIMLEPGTLKWCLKSGADVSFCKVKNSVVMLLIDWYICVGTKMFLVFLCTIAVIVYVCNWTLLSKERTGYGNGR